MSSVLFVYEKNGEIKAIDNSYGKKYHNNLFENGWKHASTIDAMIFIENLYNNTPEKELLKNLKSLTSTENK